MESVHRKVSVILLAGGTGSRMGLSFPKQYLRVGGKEIALYSFELFDAHPDVSEIVVVCKPEFQNIFLKGDKPLYFALPGLRRQDSTYNGLQALKEPETLICVHDAARPCLTLELLNKIFKEASKTKAAVLGVPATSTLKEVDAEGFMVKTIERSKVWAIQTPQVVDQDLLKRGFQKVLGENLEVTDESSILGYLNYPVKVVQSSSRNLKLTEPSDLKIIETFLFENSSNVL